MPLYTCLGLLTARPVIYDQQLGLLKNQDYELSSACELQIFSAIGAQNLVFNEALARHVVATYCSDTDAETGLIVSFTQVCSFLSENPDRFSWKGKCIPSVLAEDGLNVLAKRYFSGYNKSDFPAMPCTVPDKMVSIVMQEAYGYTEEESERIKIDHQLAMCAENCVGALLERYLDSVLRQYGWHWCCGSFVKAIDFVGRDADGTWLALQIKNRDNSENSSSSAIRHGTLIEKWFRSYSRSGETNWGRLPPLMRGYGLSEKNFIIFARKYLENEKLNRLIKQDDIDPSSLY